MTKIIESDHVSSLFLDIEDDLEHNTVKRKAKEFMIVANDIDEQDKHHNLLLLIG